MDLLRRSLQKVLARTIGDRDCGIFEAVHLGLRLPLVFPLADCVSLNTSGARVIKAQKFVRDAADDAPVVWDSKLDMFDRRRALAEATAK